MPEGGSIEPFVATGYSLIDTSLGERLGSIRARFVAVFDHVARLNGRGPVRSDADIERLYRGEHRPLWVGAYDTLRYLPEVSALAAEPAFLDAARACDIRFPALANRLIVRADMPADDKWAFPPHQDYVYNHGSLNSITIWIPFQDVPAELGPLHVWPGSHLGGLKPQKGGLLVAYDEGAARPVPMRLGQALVFSQFLPHRSGLNRSGTIRFSLQIRYNDLSSAHYARRAYFINRASVTTDPEFATAYPVDGEARF